MTCTTLPILTLSILMVTTIAQSDEDGHAPGRVEQTSSFNDFSPRGSSGEAVDLPAYMDSIGLDAVEWYQHVQTLANPWFEGREPGTPGGRRAAEYVAWHLDRYGCEPLFEPTDNPVVNAMWTADPDGNSWYQPFEFNPGRRTRTLEYGTASLGATELIAGETFNVLGNSGSGTVEAPATFVGYAIEDGPDGYTSYADSDDLTGRIAVMLRYEPLDEEGASRWSEDEFSDYAGLGPKFESVIERGATGIVLVNPPGAAAGRRGLETFRRSRRFRPYMEVPVIHVSEAAMDAWLADADAAGRSTADLRALADRGGVTAIDLHEDHPIRLDTNISTGVRDAQNVAGMYPGRGALADEWLVIGGHYDHLGRGYVGSREPRSSEIHYGADDNASGTATIIQLAKRLALNDDGEGDRRSIVFIGFDAEEAGLHGSEYFLENAPMDPSSIIAMLNMDMMGRLRDNRVSLSGTGTAVEFDEMLPRVVEPTGLIINASPGGMGPSDHSNFFMRDIPVLFFYTGDHNDYHTPRDHAWTVNPEGTARIIGLVGDLAEEMLTRDEMLTFQKSTDPGRARRTGAKVRLGIMPSYTSDLETGVLVNGVSEDTSASAAGITEGDVLLMWDDVELEDGSILMQQLMKHEPGDVVTLKIRRDGKVIEIPVTLKSRDETT